MAARSVQSALMAAHMIFSCAAEAGRAGGRHQRGRQRTRAASSAQTPTASIWRCSMCSRWAFLGPPVQVEPERRDGRIAARGALQARAVASETVDMLVPGTALLPGMPVPGLLAQLAAAAPAGGGERADSAVGATLSRRRRWHPHRIAGPGWSRSTRATAGGRDDAGRPAWRAGEPSRWWSLQPDADLPRPRACDLAARAQGEDLEPENGTGRRCGRR